MQTYCVVRRETENWMSLRADVGERCLVSSLGVICLARRVGSWLLLMPSVAGERKGYRSTTKEWFTGELHLS